MKRNSLSAEILPSFYFPSTGAQSSCGVITQTIDSNSVHFLTLGKDKFSYLEQQAHQLSCGALLMPLR